MACRGRSVSQLAESVENCRGTDPEDHDERGSKEQDEARSDIIIQNKVNMKQTEG